MDPSDIIKIKAAVRMIVAICDRVSNFMLDSRKLVGSSDSIKDGWPTKIAIVGPNRKQVQNKGFDRYLAKGLITHVAEMAGF